ncbi:MAG TPA: UPF0175 family protein [Candidatus Deferrimicrobium sp.]|nr:UPF0175 family protein [Candidatus Deferrimicrobium sp.]
MAKTVTSRLPDEMVEELEKIAAIEKLDKSSVIRRLLNKAITSWKLEYAITMFKNNEISLGKAAETCNLSIWELLSKLAEYKTPIHFDIEELKQDLELVKKEF